MKTKKPTRARSQATNITLPEQTKKWAEAYAAGNPRYGSLSALVRTLLENEKRVSEASSEPDPLLEILTAAVKSYRGR